MHPHHNAARTTSKRLAIVARVSTEDQEQYGTSLDDQVAKGRLLAQLHDYSVDDRPYEEGGHIYSGDESGTTPLAHRKIMRRLIADAKARKFDAVCFARIDRIARRLKYILEIWDALDDAGVTVLVIDPAIDTSTPIGRLIRNVLGSISEFERDTFLDRSMAGRRCKLARGELFLPAGKYGYRYTPIDHQTHTPGHVTINEDQAAVVHHIFERRARKASYERIAAELTADGVPSPTGGRVWAYSTVAYILKDRAYMGEGTWGRRVNVRTSTGKRSSRLRTDGAPPISVRYPIIVPPELWRAANEVENRGGAPTVRTDAQTYLLHGGMVRCGEHDRVMTGTSSSSNDERRRYRCVRCLPTGRRTVHQVLSRPLDEAVWAEVIAFLADPTRGREHARKLAEDTEKRLEALAARQLVLLKQLEDLDEEAAELMRLARRRTIRQERLDASMAEVERDQDQVREEMAGVQAEIALVTQDLPQAEDIERICSDLAQGVVYATPHERRELLESLQVQVTMDGLDYTITGIVPELTLRGSLPDPATVPAGQVQSYSTYSRLAASRPASPAGPRRRHTSRPGSCPRGGSVPGV